MLSHCQSTVGTLVVVGCDLKHSSLIEGHVCVVSLEILFTMHMF